MTEIIVNKKHITRMLSLAIILVFVFYPISLETIPFIAKYDVCLNLLILLGIIFYYISYRRMQSVTLLVIIFVLIQLCQTILNYGDIKAAIWGKGVLIIAMCGSIQWGYNYSERLFIKTAYIVFYFLLVINFMSLFLYPEGMYIDQRGISNTNFFLGNYNGFIVYIFLALISGYLYHRKYGKRLTLDYLLLWILSILTVLKVHSATSLTGIFLLMMYLLFFNKGWSRGVLNVKTYIIINAVFFLFFVWNSSQSVFLRNITAFFHKDITFTGRTEIWRGLRPLIREHWFWGKGLVEGERLVNELNLVHAVNAHNLYLDLLLKNGVIGIIPIVLFFLIMLNKVKKIEDKCTRYFFEAVLGIVMLMCQFEAYSIKFVFFLLLYMYMFSLKNGKM